jgi:hypothetical protein
VRCGGLAAAGGIGVQQQCRKERASCGVGAGTGQPEPTLGSEVQLDALAPAHAEQHRHSRSVVDWFIQSRVRSDIGDDGPIACTRASTGTGRMRGVVDRRVGRLRVRLSRQRWG